LGREWRGGGGGGWGWGSCRWTLGGGGLHGLGEGDLGVEICVFILHRLLVFTPMMAAVGGRKFAPFKQSICLAGALASSCRKFVAVLWEGARSDDVRIISSPGAASSAIRPGAFQ